MTTPAAELRKAANLLRDKATAAIHEGRTTWSTGNTLGSRSPVVLDDPEQPSVLIETYAARLERVNSYLALLGPATGLALADWLDTAAEYYAPGPTHPTHVVHALAVARQILSTTVQPEDEAPADDRAAVLREAADLLSEIGTPIFGARSEHERGLMYGAERLRRLADEAQQPAPAATEETRP